MLGLGKVVLCVQLLSLGYKLHGGYLKDQPSPSFSLISALKALALDHWLLLSLAGALTIPCTPGQVLSAVMALVSSSVKWEE